MGDFFKIIFGDFPSWIVLFGYVWFFIIGYIIYGLTETSGRNITSPNTPRKWSWKFWFLDNWRRYIVTFLCSYVLFRFYTEFSGHTFGNFDAVTLGLIGDGIAATIKGRVKTIAGDKEQLTIKIKKEINEEEIG